ncbi:MAG TPA: CDP-diacylglycerol--serine O-phosphatidyltransferase [Candidatus Acidoferrum sp.]|nr:CDP-diacylglycerol--serine O-phosphatidyltransferase [Candidatus Acidoferrum sp.]
MPELDQHEIPFEGRRNRMQARLRRGIFLLPAMMTSANLLCGYYAVVASVVGTPEDFNHAAKAIGIAIVFDSLDGRVARMTGSNTEFGVQFDSLADVVSFGVAPAVLAYSWGVRSVADLAPGALRQLGHFGWLCCLAFLICCAWRLARFNVQGMAPGGSKYFIGMPTPAAAGVIASIVHAFHRGSPLMDVGAIVDWRWSVAWLLLAVALGGLMTSTIRFYSFKDLPWGKKQPAFLILLTLLLLAVIWNFSEIALIFIACTYAITGVTLHLVRFFRHRLVSRTAS